MELARERRKPATNGSWITGTPSMTFHSILYDRSAPAVADMGATPECIRDLNIDQIIDAIVRGREEYDLAPFFLMPLATMEAVGYRHEVMRDLQEGAVLECVAEFADAMRSTRKILAHSAKLRTHQQTRLFLDAVRAYDAAVVRLCEKLERSSAKSAGLRAFCAFLAAYVQSEQFRARTSASGALLRELDAIRYSVRIKENTVTVGRYEDRPDYSDEVARTFEKFNQGEVRDYLVAGRDSIEMNHVEERILALVARLFPATFAKLTEFEEHHRSFVDATVTRFDREIQFYLAYLEYMNEFAASGLSFCYPHVSTDGGDSAVRDTFDAALAKRLRDAGREVVVNDFALTGGERVLIVSGPNQGGKSTFARTFGQVHHFASIGCPVAGSAARIALFDRIFTHFEREERVESLRSKLEDDLLRMRDILRDASERSIVILNEIFASTTRSDAYWLGRQMLAKILRIGARCVCVTFLNELAHGDDRIVNMVSTVVADNPAVRTFKVVRRAAGEPSYAATLAEKHRLTHDLVKARIRS